MRQHYKFDSSQRVYKQLHDCIIFFQNNNTKLVLKSVIMGSLMYNISGQFAKYMQNVRPNGIVYNYQRFMATFQPREFHFETSDGGEN